MSGTVITNLFYEDERINRKKLFEQALSHTKHGKVLYILKDVLTELPELSQDISSIDRHYIKMISFLYVSNTISLIESLASLTEWEHIPSTIILESLNNFANKNSMQNACGVVAMLLDAARSCSIATGSSCNLYISITKDVAYNDYYILIKELYVT